MRILICSPEHNKATGNWVTASRYRRGLESFSHQVSLCHVSPSGPSFADESLAAMVDRIKPDLLVLLHAYRLGKLWLQQRQQINCPVVVMLSGTDVNEGLQQPEQAVVIEEVLSQADGLMAHNALMIESLQCQYPEVAARLHYLPAAIELGTGDYPLRQQIDCTDDAVLFLCPASIRPVKGVIHLIELFDSLVRQQQEWQQKWQLVFCGPELDDSYSQHLHRAVNERPWVHYLGVIPPESMAAVMKQADVVVNNSKSEGLPNALIEASVLGKPILASDILGNRPIVDHGVNGFLYQDQQQFCQFCTELIVNHQLRDILSQPRADRYHIDCESRELDRICREVYDRACR